MRTSLLRTVGTAMAALALLNAGEALAQYGPGVGADQLVLRDPVTGNVFVLRAPSAPGAPANTTLELPNMTGVPSVAGILMMIDNSSPTKRITLTPPAPNSVLITQAGAPFFSTTLPNGLTIPGATITTPTVSGGTMNGTAVTGGSINNTPIGNTTPSTGVFTNLSSAGNTAVGTGAGAATAVGNNTGTTNVQGSTVNLGTSDGTPGAAGETTNNIGYNDGDGAGPSGPSQTNINGNVTIGSDTGNNGGPTTTTINGTLVIDSIVFTTTPSIPLQQNAILVGNGSNVAAPYNSTGVNGAVLAQNATGAPTWTGATNFTSTTGSAPVTNINAGDANNGSGTEAVTNIGYNDPDGASAANGPSTTNINGNVTIGSATGNNGGPTTTTINGTIVFSNPPSIGLPQNNLWVGNASGVQQAVPPTANSVLITNNVAGGTPQWGTTLPGGLTLPTATITNPTLTGGSINNTPIGNTTPSTGVFTNLSSAGNTAVGTGAGAATAVGNNTGTTNVQGSTVNLGTSDGTPGAAGETTNNIGYNDGDGAGPSGPSQTNINGNVTIGSDTGNNGGPTVTTINGTVVFDSVVFNNPPQITLPQNNLWVGNGSGVQQAFPPSPNSILVTNNVAGGTPLWSTTLPGGLTIPGATITGGSINNTPIGNTTPSTGSFTNLNSTGNTGVGTGAGSTATVGNSTGTTTIDGQTINIGHAGGTTTINGTVNFTTPPSIPLAQNNIWVGNGSGMQQAVPPTPNSILLTNNVAGGTPQWGTTLPGGLTIPTATITGATITGGSINNTPIGNTTPSTGVFTNLSSTGNVAVGTGAGSTAAVGNSTGTTTIDGQTINVGHAGGTTNLNGTVNFTSTPSIPLQQNALFVGNGSNIAAAYNSTNVSGAVLGQNATGTPTWTSATNFTSTTGSAPVTNINAGDANNGSGTEAVTNIGYNDPDGASAANGPSTTNINGNVTIGSATGNNGGPTTTTINGTIVFSNPPSIGLPQNNLWVGNASGVQQAVPPTANSVLITNNVAGGTPQWGTTLPGGLTVPNATITGATITGGSINNTPIGNITPSTGSFTNLNSTGNTGVGTGAGSTATVGNSTGTTNISGQTINLGGAGSTTNIGGTVNFSTMPNLPLPTNNIYLGVGGIATALPPGTNGQVLKIVGSTPTWGAAPSGSSFPNGTVDNSTLRWDATSSTWLENARLLSVPQSGTRASEFRFTEPSASGTNYTAFRAKSQARNLTYVLPDTLGVQDEVLGISSVSGDTAVLDWRSQGQGKIIYTVKDSAGAPLPGNVPDFNPGPGSFSMIRISSNVVSSIHGMAQGIDGYVVILYNAGTKNITLMNLSATGTAGHRFEMANNLGISPQETATFVYDAAGDGGAGSWHRLARN